MIVKAHILIFILLLSLMNVNAQTYFNNKYDATGGFDGTNSIDTFQNKYLTVGVEQVFFGNWGLSSYLLNLDGTIYKKN